MKSLSKHSHHSSQSNSSLAPLSCVYRGQGAQGITVPFPLAASTEKHILADSVCTREAAEQDGLLSMSFKSVLQFVILVSQMWHLFIQNIFGCQVSSFFVKTKRTAGTRLKIDGPISSIRRDQALKLSPNNTCA